jgi:hypothetical protein
MPLESDILEAKLFFLGQPNGDSLEAMLALLFSPTLHTARFGHGPYSSVRGVADVLLWRYRDDILGAGGRARGESQGRGTFTGHSNGTGKLYTGGTGFWTPRSLSAKRAFLR